MLQRHLGSDIINLAETFILILLAGSFTFCGRNVHEIRDVSAKNCGRNGSWPKRPVTFRPGSISARTNMDVSAKKIDVSAKIYFIVLQIRILFVGGFTE